MPNSSRCPNARFHYVGHSNGTYCLAKALELYPCCQFDRVVFAGSVVRTSFNWSKFLPAPNQEHKLSEAEPQVRNVLNYIATADLVVAFFPKIFQYLPFLRQDLGSAGFDGFADNATTGKVTQVHYVLGGHGAAIKEPNWDAITEFVYSGKLLGSGAASSVFRAKRALPFKIVGAVPVFGWLVALIVALFGAAIIGGITYLVMLALARGAARLVTATGLITPPNIAALQGAAGALATVTGAFSVWKVITKL